MESISERTMYVYEQLLQREIPNRDAEFNCGRSWLEAERPELAEEVFRRLMESGYQVTESRFRLSQALFAQQRYVEAKQELIKLLQDEPEHEEALEFFQEFQDHVNRGQPTTTTKRGQSMGVCAGLIR
jgi:tetratricopeptide (TPR) repeat protein